MEDLRYREALQEAIKRQIMMEKERELRQREDVDL